MKQAINVYAVIFLLTYFNAASCAGKPNIILIITDDQDVELGSMSYMPHVRRIFRDGGVDLVNGFVSTPMCCPSRSSLLTGVYVHNHNVLTNNDNCSSLLWQREWETRSFATYLSKSGYRTGYFGKYLNQYAGTHIPAGWTEWVGLIKNSRYYNYTLNFNGQKVKHGDNYHQDYFPDLIINDSITFLKQSKQYFSDTPIGMVLSFPSPHGPEDSAPQFQGMFENVTTHRTPSWNYAPNPDKQSILQQLGKMDDIYIAFTDLLHRKRLQTLQSVDEAVLRLFQELESLGELNNTYVLYTSDHGYHLGQFGLVKGKAMPYEFDIKVPFFLRGPGIPQGVSVLDIAMNIDIAPTILDMAGISVPSHMDGQSLLPLFKNPRKSRSGESIRRKSKWRDTVLIERGKITERKIKGRERSEAQQNTLIGETKVQRLQEECQKPEYQSPCQENQQWECRRRANGNYRMTKCRKDKQISRCLKIICPGEPAYSTFQVNDKECRVVGNNGTVVCDQEIYNVRSAWMQEKEDVEAHIESLRQRLHELRSIKKHLKEWRPELLSEEEGDDFIHERDTSGESLEDGGETNLASVAITPFQKTGAEDLDIEILSDGCVCVKDEQRRRKRIKRNHDRNLDLRMSRDLRRQRKQEKRLKQKQRKGRKKKRMMMMDCGTVTSNCFYHDNEHWKTPPRWTLGHFCFCPNSNNSTYWCVRTVNATHNFLYCEFIDGFISFYDITEDPYQLHNAIHELTFDQHQVLHLTLDRLKSCSGRSCSIRGSDTSFTKKRSERRRNQHRLKEEKGHTAEKGHTEIPED